MAARSETARSAPAVGPAERRRAFAALVTAGVPWGASLPLGKVALREIGPTWLIVWRFALAVAAFAVVVRWRSLRLTPALAAQVVAGGVLAGVVVFLVQFEGLARTTATSAALLVAVGPPLIAVLAALVDGERGGRSTWTAVGLSVLGVALLAGAPGPGRSLVGDALCLTAMVGTAVWVLLTRRIAWALGPVEAAALQFLVGLAVLVPAAFWREGPPPALSPVGWSALLFLGLGCTAVTFWLWNWGIMRVEAARAGVIANLEPAIGALLGVAVLGEQITPLSVIGGITLLLAAFLATRPETVATTPRPRRLQSPVRKS